MGGRASDDIRTSCHLRIGAVAIWIALPGCTRVQAADKPPHPRTRKTRHVLAQAISIQGEKLNILPKFVASRTLDTVTWNNSILLKGDVAQEVAKLKAQEGGEIQVHGSGNLIQTLLQHDLVDTIRIWQFPVVLGTGKRLFGGGTLPRSFRLVDTQVNTTGAVLHVYERAGGLKYGEVEVGQEVVIFDAEPSLNTDDGEREMK
jgi:dihydrofolate reductase